MDPAASLQARVVALHLLRLAASVRISPDLGLGRMFTTVSGRICSMGILQTLLYPSGGCVVAVVLFLMTVVGLSAGCGLDARGGWMPG